MRSKEVLSNDEPLVERIAEEILRRQRDGERPTVDEYCIQYPEHAEELRAFLPALMVVEGLKPNSKDLSGTFGGPLNVEGKRREFIGDYRILRELGRGGMGVVYEAEQQSLGRHVALKVLLRSVAGDARAAKRFESEAKAAARMHHTNIVPVFDVGSDDEHLFYAMQLIQGQALDLVVDDLKQLRNVRNSSSAAAQDKAKAQDKSIARSLVAGHFHQDQLLEQAQESSLDAPEVEPIQAPSPLAPLAGRGIGGEGAFAVTETLDARTGSSHSAVMPGQRDMSSAENNRPAYFLSVARIGHQTAEALAYAHARGIIHRDIKPANLLLDGSGIVWITDFGLAKTGDHGMTHTGDILGTIRYMSPERFKGQCDVRADIYSLGLTLYELLTLQPAFSAADQLKLIDRIVQSEPPAPRTLDASVPRDLETIVLKCIDKDPRRRYQSADELCEDLDRFIHDEPVKARRISLPERLARWSRRNKAMAASLAVVASLLLIINIAGPLITWRMATLKDAANQKADEAIAAEKRALEAQQLANERSKEANQARRLADQRAETINRNLYLSNMNLASVAAQSRFGIEQVLKLTDEWHPQPGQPDLRGWEWYYLRSLLHQNQHTLGHSAVRTVMWHPDGRRLVSSSRDTIQIWDAISGAELETWRNQAGDVGSIAWSPDGTKVAFTSNGSICEWDPGKGEILSSFGGPTGAVESGLWSPDGQRFVSVSSSRERGDDTIRVFDAADGQPVTLDIGYAVAGLAWRPDSTQLASAGMSGGPGAHRAHLTIWNALSGENLGALPISANLVLALAWSPDGSLLAAGTQRRIDVWDIASRQVLMQLPDAGTARAISFSPDGSRIAAGMSTRVITVWDLDAERERISEVPDGLEHASAIGEPLLTLKGHTDEVDSIAWSPDGKHLASGCSGDHTVRIWDVDQLLNSQSNRESEALIGDCTPIAWVSQASPVVLKPNADTHQFHLWNAETFQLLRTVDYQLSTLRIIPSRVWLSPDARQLAASTSNGIAIWDTVSGELQQSWDLPRHPAKIAWSPNGRLLASGGFQDGSLVRIFDAVTGEQRQPLRGHTSDVRSIAWSWDGKRLATGTQSRDPTVRIWDVGTGECSNILAGHTGSVRALSWSPDGKYLATEGSGFTIYLCNVETGEKEKALSGHTRNLESLAWSPDGKRLASLGAGNRLIIWDPDTGRETYSMEFLVEQWSGSVSWSPDGRILAASSKGRVKLLDARKGYAEQEERLRNAASN